MKTETSTLSQIVFGTELAPETKFRKRFTSSNAIPLPAGRGILNNKEYL
jgi:hypothetical protein